MLTTVKLQNIVLVKDMDANFISYPELMAKAKDDSDPFIYDPEEKGHILRAYTSADMMTYFNCLQVSRWNKYTGVDNFKINLTFKGKFAIELYEIYRNSDNVCFNLIQNTVYSSKAKTEIVIDVPETDKDLIGFKLVALEDSCFYKAWYSADIEEENIRDIHIALATTTFKKQAYIKNNIAMLKEKVLCEGSDLKGHLFVEVIDNERALDPEKYDCEDLKIYPNNNVGGSGGFTRGMIEALHLETKPTHVLLMDDDVMIMPESLFRTYYLLRILKPEYHKRFLSGAMFDYDHREMQYEDVGFVHKADASYGPVKPKMDMREIKNVVANESYDYDNYNDAYAGWWYCCIPVEDIEENGLPMPVFVRGDDVEYSLRIKPGFLTLNGVCIWHVGFAGKFNAALELYQVHRNSFVVQAASGICEDIDFLKRIKELFWKDITRFAYNNAELLLDSVEDYLRGPKFIENLDGEKSLKEHGAKNEQYVPVSQLDYTISESEDPYTYTSLNIIEKIIYVLTINGHLLPGFLLNRTPKVIAYDWFFVPGKNFMRKRLIAYNQRQRTACVRTMDRKRCFELIKRYRYVMEKYKRIHVKVEKAYRKQFERMTTEKFWKEYLDI